MFGQSAMPPMHLDVTPVLPQPTGEVRVQRGEARRGEGAARRGEATRDEGAAWLCLKRLWFVTMQQNAGKKRPNTRRKAFTPVAPGARCAERVYLRLILRHLASLFPARPAPCPPQQHAPGRVRLWTGRERCDGSGCRRQECLWLSRSPIRSNGESGRACCRPTDAAPTPLPTAGAAPCRQLSACRCEG